MISPEIDDREIRYLSIIRPMVWINHYCVLKRTNTYLGNSCKNIWGFNEGIDGFISTMPVKKVRTIMRYEGSVHRYANIFPDTVWFITALQNNAACDEVSCTESL
jgi:hypothetical protein